MNIFICLKKKWIKIDGFRTFWNKRTRWRGVSGSTECRKRRVPPQRKAPPPNGAPRKKKKNKKETKRGFPRPTIFFSPDFPFTPPPPYLIRGSALMFDVAVSISITFPYCSWVLFEKKEHPRIRNSFFLKKERIGFPTHWSYHGKWWWLTIWWSLEIDNLMRNRSSGSLERCVSNQSWCVVVLVLNLLLVFFSSARVFVGSVRETIEWRGARSGGVAAHPVRRDAIGASIAGIRFVRPRRRFLLLLLLLLLQFSKGDSRQWPTDQLIDGPAPSPPQPSSSLRRCIRFRRVS